MTDAARLLRAYDDQLRTDAETPSAVAVVRHGPLRLVTFPGGRGFVTYRDLGGTRGGTAPDGAATDGVTVTAGGVTAEGVARLVAHAVEHFRADPAIERVEWKSRGHDHAPGLHEALLAHDFVADEPESIMIGETRVLAVDVPLPDGVALRRVTAERDVRAMCAMQDEAFGDPPSERMADAVLRRLALDDGMQLWVAEADGRVVSAGRLEPVAGSEFAGIWGGATLAPWRGRGIYRALTAARARAALAMGRTLMHSDSTEYSRPILERSGMVRVSTTTPYHWNRRG